MIVDLFPQNVSCFNNPAVEKCVRDSLTSAGVVCHTDAYLATWNDGDLNGDDITSVSFTTQGQGLRLECGALFSFFAQEVDKDAFTGSFTLFQSFFYHS